MKKTKATFRAYREITGLSQQVLADMLKVDVRSIKRWEHPDNTWEAAEDAWNILEQFRDLQEQQVQFALDKADEIEDMMGDEPKEISLTYWPNKQVYEMYHPGEGHLWQSANATIRQTAIELEADGYNVVFKYANDGTYLNEAGEICSFDTAVNMMDDELREELNDELAPCTEQEFIEAYAKAHEERFGEKWAPYCKRGQW